VIDWTTSGRHLRHLPESRKLYKSLSRRRLTLARNIRPAQTHQQMRCRSLHCRHLASLNRWAELGHAIGKLTDEYQPSEVPAFLASDSIINYVSGLPTDPSNCSSTPNYDFRSTLDNRLYGALDSAGCIYDSSYKPNPQSIMGSALWGTNSALYKFNVIDCGYLIAGLKGFPADKEHAEKYWVQCKGLSVLKDGIPLTAASTPALLTGTAGLNISGRVVTFTTKATGPFFSASNNAIRITKGTSFTLDIPSLSSSNGGKVLSFTLPNSVNANTSASSDYYNIQYGAFNSNWSSSLKLKVLVAPSAAIVPTSIVASVLPPQQIASYTSASTLAQSLSVTNVSLNSKVDTANTKTPTVSTEASKGIVDAAVSSKGACLDWDNDQISDVTTMVLTKEGIRYQTLLSSGSMQENLVSDKSALPASADYEGKGQTELATITGKSGDLVLTIAGSNGVEKKIALNTPVNFVITGCDLDGDSKADFAGIDTVKKLLNYVRSSDEGSVTLPLPLSASSSILKLSCGRLSGAATDSLLVYSQERVQKSNGRLSSKRYISAIDMKGAVAFKREVTGRPIVDLFSISDSNLVSPQVVTVESAANKKTELRFYTAASTETKKKTLRGVKIKSAEMLTTGIFSSSFPVESSKQSEPSIAAVVLDGNTLSKIDLKRGSSMLLKKGMIKEFYPLLPGTKLLRCINVSKVPL